MNRSLLLLTVLLAGLGGCTTNQYAHMLLEQDTGLGRFREGLVDSAEHLARDGKISFGRTIAAADGTSLDVWVIKADPGPEPAGTVLVLHELGDSKANYLGLGQMLSRRGFDVVLPDLRAHGRSGGEYVTFGAFEKQDQKQVMDQLLAARQVAAPLYVLGCGMGGSVAIMYAAEEPRVQGVMAISPARDLLSSAQTACADLFRFTDKAMVEAVCERAGQIAGFNPAEVSAVKAAGRLHCPLLLVHGQFDASVPYADSQAIYAAAGGRKELDIVPFAGHVTVSFMGEERVADDMDRLAAGRLKAASQPATMPAASN